MLERAVAANVPFRWVTGDTVYGGDRRLRVWLEQHTIPHVLAVKRTEPLFAWSATHGFGQIPAHRLLDDLDPADWLRLSAGQGAKGRRLYDWARVNLYRLGWPSNAGFWLLVRRSISNPTELAFYACFGPADTPLSGLVEVAGTRWTIEECFQQAKGEAGLDHYQVRRWTAWYRHITLALLAQAFLAAVRANATSYHGQKGS
jgi:SRSO17 transposase